MIKVGDKVVLANASGIVGWVSATGNFFEFVDDDSGKHYVGDVEDIVTHIPFKRRRAAKDKPDA